MSHRKYRKEPKKNEMFQEVQEVHVPAEKWSPQRRHAGTNSLHFFRDLSKQFLLHFTFYWKFPGSPLWDQRRLITYLLWLWKQFRWHGMYMFMHVIFIFITANMDYYWSFIENFQALPQWDEDASQSGTQEV